MFLLKQILFCTPLIIYAGFRIWKLIQQTFFKTLFIIFYIFFVLAFPLAQTLSHASGMEWANFIMIAGYFSLPLLLYLVLWVPLVDLALGVALLTRILNKETVKRRRFRKAWLFLILRVPYFSKYALQVFCKPSSTSIQKDLCRKMMKSPVPDEKKFERIWKNHVYPLKGQYTMNP